MPRRKNNSSGIPVSAPMHCESRHPDLVATLVTVPIDDSDRIRRIRYCRHCRITVGEFYR